VSLGTIQGFRDKVEASAKALESSISKQMMVHLVHKGTARRIFHSPHGVCAATFEIAQSDGLSVFAV
jgi:hypothetical protein